MISSIENPAVPEAEYIAHLRAIAKLAGIPNLILAVDTDPIPRLRCRAQAPDLVRGQLCTEYGATLDEAIAKLRNAMGSPAEVVRSLKREANRLLAIAAEAETQAAIADELRTEGKKHEANASFHD